jgi:predicted amidophosphoribosyltransferase
MEFRCPYCNAPIYSRKNKICGVCERPLPKELLLSDEQVAFLKKEMEQEEKRASDFHLPDLPDLHGGR